jgi:hypothetical protein
VGLQKVHKSETNVNKDGENENRKDKLGSVQETLTELLHGFSKLRPLHLYSARASKKKNDDFRTKKKGKSQIKRMGKLILMVCDKRE